MYGENKIRGMIYMLIGAMCTAAPLLINYL